MNTKRMDTNLPWLGAEALEISQARQEANLFKAREAAAKRAAQSADFQPQTEPALVWKPRPTAPLEAALWESEMAEAQAPFRHLIPTECQVCRDLGLKPGSLTLRSFNADPSLPHRGRRWKYQCSSNELHFYHFFEQEHLRAASHWQGWAGGLPLSERMEIHARRRQGRSLKGIIR